MAVNKTINKRTNTHEAMRNCIECQESGIIHEYQESGE